jgi:hypothetical protein
LQRQVRVPLGHLRLGFESDGDPWSKSSGHVTIRLEFDLSKRRNDEQLSTKLRYGEVEATIYQRQQIVHMQAD